MSCVPGVSRTIPGRDACLRQRAVARSCARVGPPPFLSTNVRRCWPGARVLRSCARIATSVRDSRATVHGGSERFHAVGEAGFLPASLLLVPASLLAIRVVSGGGGIRTPEGPNGPLRFSRPPHPGWPRLEHRWNTSLERCGLPRTSTDTAPRTDLPISKEVAESAM